MGSFKLGGMTFGSLFKKPETLLYPAQVKTPYPHQKGHIANKVDECILCGMCARVCPCHCITVDKKAHTWEIDPFSCILCGSCVRSCPTTCLLMEPASTAVAARKHVIDLAVPDKKAASEA
jgi:Formate hydrogenlyase subunit 6/NADH:ubiquinone oxidoreductase 23 kD subunit (chain I)